MISADGSRAMCMRVSTGASHSGTNANGEPYYIHILDGSYSYSHPSHTHSSASTAPNRSPAELAELARLYELDGWNQVPPLANKLGVSVDSLRALGVGWDGKAWTFPERDATGNVIGISRRFPDGKKWMLRGSGRGLTYCQNWANAFGPVLLVEGGSDTAAAMTIGLCVIGRPSNKGGVPQLVELLRQYAERDIIVVGERDEKADGRWPGRDGAIDTATALAKQLGRTVHWAFPPGEAKDTRAWLNSHAGAGSVEQLRRQYLDGLVTTAIEPPPAPQVEVLPEDTRPIYTLEEYRAEIAAKRQMTLGSCGLFYDGSPTGAGKSHADLAVQKQVPKSLTALPDHSNCAEAAAKMREHGLNAMAHPDLKETCSNLQEANRALDLGLQPGAAVCPDCEKRVGCEYRAQSEAAKKSAHLVVTHKRGETSLSSLAEGRDLLFFHEDPRQLLRPMVKLSAADVQAARLALEEARIRVIGKRIRSNPEMWKRDQETADFLLTMIETASSWEAALRDATQSELHECQAQTQPASTRNWQRAVYRAMKTGTIAFRGEVIKSLAAAVLGEADRWGVQVDNVLEKGGARKTAASLVVLWATELPSNMSIWLEDATGDARHLEDLTGQFVLDMTPAGRLEHEVRPVQVPIEVTREISVEKVRGIIQGLVAEHPAAMRIGLIAHKPHIDAMIPRAMREGAIGYKSQIDAMSPQGEDGYLPPAILNRIAIASHFGSGIDRASNRFLECDLLLIVGTPRLSPAVIRSELIRLGDLAAANDPEEGSWGERHWQGQTDDGRRMVVEGKGYADPAWRAAHDRTVRAALLQAIGRARPVLPEGVPAVVVSTEPVWLALRRQPLRPVTRSMWDVAFHFVPNAKKDTLGVGTKWRSSATTIAARLGVTEGAVRKQLELLAAAGLVVRLEGHKAGWEATEALQILLSSQSLQNETPGASPDAAAATASTPETCHTTTIIEPVVYSAIVLPEPLVEADQVVVTTETPAIATVSGPVVEVTVEPPPLEPAPAVEEEEHPPDLEPAAEAGELQLVPEPFEEYDDEYVDPEWCSEAWEERAAIHEFEANMTREEAELEACVEVPCGCPDSDADLPPPPPDAPPHPPPDERLAKVEGILASVASKLSPGKLVKGQNMPPPPRMM